MVRTNHQGPACSAKDRLSTEQGRKPETGRNIQTNEYLCFNSAKPHDTGVEDYQGEVEGVFEVRGRERVTWRVSDLARGCEQKNNGIIF